jgi:putative signal transducing protein/zinc ribbon protein
MADEPPGDPLSCPSCGRSHPAEERFCANCGLPLVQGLGEEHEPSERQRTARKIKPQYTEGRLVGLTRADNQPQAEFIANLLLEEGIPCLVRSSTAGYAPLIGEREIMVTESALEAARETLAFRRPAES